MLWSLLDNDSNILLAPIKPATAEQSLGPTLASSYLKLSRAINDEPLDQEQLRFLVSLLPKLLDKATLRLHSVKRSRLESN